jgi:A/G-specific adenine glycosylase
MECSHRGTLCLQDASRLHLRQMPKGRRPKLNRRETLGAISAASFRRKLLRWFDQHKRNLPWRQDRDVYRVWVSEIMLQQTRVAAVIEHYNKFLLRFPTIKKLAAARGASVLAAWSGLGYYRRARLLHAAAKKVVYDLSEEFPTSAVELQALPGVGRYTSAAIASIAFGQPVAAVDGNVERVLQRISGKQMRNGQLGLLAEHLLSRSRPGDFNQAMMELGATVCGPRQPKCLLCPVSEMCASRGELAGVHKAQRQKKRDIYYSLDCCNGSVFLLQRDKAARLMPGMWELPEVPPTNDSAAALLKLRHSITVTDYVVHVMLGAAAEKTAGKWVPTSRISSLPLTGLAQKILRATQVI